MPVKKDLSKMEVILERFKLVENFPGSPLSVTEIHLDGKSISLECLVDITNKLTSALNDRGCTFTRTVKK